MKKPLNHPLLLTVALAAALAALAAGCGSVRAGGAAQPSHTASLSVSASISQAPVRAATPSVSASSALIAVPVAGPGAPAGTTVYLAEGASVTGRMLHAPGCQTGCQLSGDSTAWLYHMTWSAWNSAVAIGAGTEKLDDCTPNCAAGTQHAVPVVVTLSKPVMVCADGKGTWYWTRASFNWPGGLPAALSGANAPVNPFGYPGITAEAATAC
jgi:hypothetical protein